MQPKPLKPRKAINKAFLKIKPNRTEIEHFKTNLIELLDRTNDIESEEFHKNLVSDFLKRTYYEPNHFINTKGRNDLVIHNGNKASTTVGVIIEAKKPTNKAEMVTEEKLNAKAFQELVLYYLRERITHKNLEVKYLVATNINEWFIFDANSFDRLFAQNKNLVKQFNDFEGGRLAGVKTAFFYDEIAAPFIANLQQEIEFTHFNLQDYQKPLRNEDKKDDNKLIALYKLLSPEHLLKLPFANDSNSLDKRFYGELLHIIGLSETKEGSKKLIARNKAGERNTGCLLENAIIQLDSLDKINRLNNPLHFGATQEERLFNVSLELAITWVNRILFLKLLEAQLRTYHKGDKSYEFLSIDKIKNYDDLNGLFFEVLARKHSERNEDVKEAFAKVPYLNSSLFEPTGIEHGTLFISNLRDDKTLPIYSATVLKTENGKKRSGNLSTLEYLFEFLNAYDFSSEGSEEIQEDNKTLINASVLGLIFEKINGYKDGSFFTPGFITMYMCRETIRKAVVQKFNEAAPSNSSKGGKAPSNSPRGGGFKSLDDVYDQIDDNRMFTRQQANDIINSIKICDPAVGSGHFLVSALNEMIAIKNDLKILQDRDGRRLKEYQFEVVNDELIVTDEDGELFEYNPTNKESQRIQQALFHEKQTLIENCLFGVDINPNSVKICRLRLWIELLKNAYYKNETELETLPNIDINIKRGNSLISRFALDADLKKALKSSKWTIDSYRLAVDTYRNAENKEQKHAMERLIADIKSDFRSEISLNDPKVKKLTKLKGELFGMTNQVQMFELSKKEKAAWNKKLQKLGADTTKLETEIEEIKNNKIYEDAFEWRFEFPEVLDDNGDFVGFDVVIGNPPYVFTRTGEFSKESKNYILNYVLENSIATSSKGLNIQKGKINLFAIFVIKAIEIINTNGFQSFIVPNNILRATPYEAIRKWLLTKSNIDEIVDLGKDVFDDATVSTIIMSHSKFKENNKVRILKDVDSLLTKKLDYILIPQTSFLKNAQYVLNILADTIDIKIIEKIEKTDTKLGDYFKYISPGIDGDKNKYVVEGKRDINYKPLLFGKSFTRYFIRPTNDYILYKRELLNRARKEEIFLSEKIIVQRISGGLMPLTATIDKEQYYTFNSVNNLVLKKEYKPLIEYFLALINSKLINWYYAIKFSNRSNLTVNISKTYLEILPLFITSNKFILEKIKYLVIEIINNNKENPQVDTTTLEAQIDQLVYQLYNLTEEEIAIVDGVTG